MGLFVDEKNTFDVVVNYVFDQNKELHVIKKDEVEIVKKTKEEKEEINNTLSKGTDIPFNIIVDLKDYEEKDVRTAVFTFRRPTFDDMPVLMSSIGNFGANGSFNAGNLLEFGNRKLKILFVKGVAEDDTGKKTIMNESNLGNLSPALGGAVVLGMNQFINM